MKGYMVYLFWNFRDPNPKTQVICEVTKRTKNNYYQDGMNCYGRHDGFEIFRANTIKEIFELSQVNVNIIKFDKLNKFKKRFIKKIKKEIINETNNKNSNI